MLAAIGRLESDHGRFGGAVLHTNGACGGNPTVEFEDNYDRSIAGLTEDLLAEPSLH